ncbi:MAG: DUF1707 SHOCT-like domain-containing protein [Pseudonocardiaceae bacterium]
MSTTSTTGGIRASDTEREHVARILRAATGAGLLTLDEVEDRLATGYAARFRHELDPLTADLPDPGRLLAQTPQAHTAARLRLTRHAMLVALLATLLVAAWFGSGVDFFWPVWPIAFLVFGLARHAHRVYPGAPV